MRSVLKEVLNDVQPSWRPLVVADLLYKAIAFAVLTPLISFLFQSFLALTGHEILADFDILKFFRHPLGGITMILAGGAILSVLALELATLLAILIAARHRRSLSTFDAFRISLYRARSVYLLCVRILISVMLISVPFLIIGGGVYALLLTDRDINFYLNQRPPKFWLAVSLIGCDLVTMVSLIGRRLIDWSLALPIQLFTNASTRESLRRSQDIVAGQRWAIATSFLFLFAAMVFGSLISSAVVIALLRWALPWALQSLWPLVFTLGMFLFLWTLLQVATNVLFNIFVASIIARFFTESFTGHIHLPLKKSVEAGFAARLNRGRLIAGMIIGVLLATLIGVTSIESIEFEDNVEITAHRGASAVAPENTLASVQQAMDDDTDWVEIDVQESLDGVVVVAHDSDLMKVAGVATKIWNATFEDLRKIDIGSSFDERFKDERIPTLQEVLKICQGKVKVNIELKYYGHDQDLERKVIGIVEQLDMQSDVAIMSLKLSGIRKVRALRPDWKVGLLTSVAAGDLTRTDVDFFAVNTRLAKRRLIQNAHRRGQEIQVWTVNDPLAMSTLMSRGVDNIITDRPALARKVLAQRAELNVVERLLIDLAVQFNVSPDALVDVQND